MIVNEVSLGFASLNLKHDAWQFIIGGLVLMLPMVMYVIRQTRVGRGLDE